MALDHVKRSRKRRQGHVDGMATLLTIALVRKLTKEEVMTAQGYLAAYDKKVLTRLKSGKPQAEQAIDE